jgi:hypothetical protein
VLSPEAGTLWAIATPGTGGNQSGGWKQSDAEIKLIGETTKCPYGTECAFSRLIKTAEVIVGSGGADV